MSTGSGGARETTEIFAASSTQTVSRIYCIQRKGKTGPKQASTAQRSPRLAQSKNENSNKFNATQQTLGRTLGHVTAAVAAAEAGQQGAGEAGKGSSHIIRTARTEGRREAGCLSLSAVGLPCEGVAKFRPLTFLFRHALLIRNVVRVQYELNSPTDCHKLF